MATFIQLSVEAVRQENDVSFDDDVLDAGLWMVNTASIATVRVHNGDAVTIVRLADGRDLVVNHDYDAICAVLRPLQPDPDTD
jgi:hypothetical protein